MTTSGNLPNPRRLGAVASTAALFLLAGLLAAGCGSAAPTPTPTLAHSRPPRPSAPPRPPPPPAPPAPSATPTPTPTPKPTPAPTKGPAVQHLTLAGSGAPSIAVTNAGIRCNLPISGGLQISVLAQPSDPNLSVYTFVSPGSLTIRYDSGSGPTYVERDFAGTGVTKFDAAAGATIGSALTETPINQAHGKLGAFTPIKGTIDCGNQNPGTSTLVFSGATPKGALSGGLSPVNVECLTSTNGSSVSIIGFVKVGITPHRGHHVCLTEHLHGISGTGRLLSKHRNSCGDAGSSRRPYRR